MSNIPIKPSISWSQNSETGEVAMLIRRVDTLGCAVETMRIENVSAQMFYDLANEANVAAAQVEKTQERTRQWRNVEELIKAGALIDAIKALRTVTGMDLLQAKLTVEMMLRFYRGGR